MSLAGYLTTLAITGFMQSNAGKIEVREVQKPVYSAVFESVDDKSISVTVGSQSEKLPIDGLLSLKFSENPQLPDPASTYELQLIDGTRLHAQAISSDGQSVTVQLPSRKIEFSAKFLLTVRLQRLNDEQSQAWKAISSSVVNSDVLVVLQASGSLSKIEGIVSEITDQAVSFEFSGQKIKVPFAKLAGIRFFSTDGPPRPKVKAIVGDTSANEWIATQVLSSAPDSVALTLQCGAEIIIPYIELSTLDFSVGSARYLADIEPVRQSSPLLFDFPVARVAEEQLFGARRIPPVNIPGKAIGPSLQFLGGGEATYLVPSGFTKLIGSVELRPPGEQFSRCRVQIFLERDLLWEASLAEVRQPIMFELPVESDQRLKFLVTTEAKFPAGDVVLWREPRLLK